LRQIHRSDFHPSRTRRRRRLAQPSLHGQHAHWLDLVKQLGQGVCHRFFSLAAGQVEKMHVLLVRTPRLLAEQGIIGPPVRRRRIQIFAIHIAGKGTRLADQPANHVTVVDAMLVLATQPFHPLHQLLRVPDLDLLQTDPHLYFLTDQPRRHGIGIVLDANRAHAADPHALPLQGLQTRRRQPPHGRQFHGDLGCPSGIPRRYPFPQPLLVGRAAGKVATATQ
jgi:hypothetical protein